jgi:hypothetical protein
VKQVVVNVNNQHVHPSHKKEFYAVIDDDSYLKQYEHDINAR